MPGLGDCSGDPRIGDAEVGEAVGGDDVVGGREAHAVQFLDDLLQCLHFVEAEDVVRALVPVRDPGVVGDGDARRPVGLERLGQGEGIDEPLFLDGLLPAGAGLDGAAFHGRVLRSFARRGGQPPLPEDEPKPPRSTAWLRLKVPSSAQPPLTSAS
ncbi:hypothetical protein SHIRM173S_08490 [Streptomyces hirsutus]